ncbi:MAG TPA: ThiF family adenylyltransferase, partial [Candidatus Baltobacteraceae bacterium]|nr:ThiF family adenylyltransferase [Candidatus Baltobacteraceae bacterium]
MRSADILADRSDSEVRTQSSALEQLDEWVSRNVDVINREEQATLRSMRVLVAGCGSVGGSVVEPLARLGVGAFVLADPEPYELSNINRQACFLADVGRSKAQVMAERAASINPYIETRVFAEGLSDDNLDSALVGVSVVFDGIDAGMSPWEKYALHEKACAQKIPVLAGIDFGGKAVVYVFDYRKRGVKPFFGKASAEAHRERRFAECLKWLGYTHFPADFLPIISDRVATGKPWPQVSYCVQAMGAIGTRCVLDIAMGRKVPKVVSFDTHMMSRSTSKRIVEYARLPTSIVSTYRAVRAPSHVKPPGFSL